MDPTYRLFLAAVFGTTCIGAANASPTGGIVVAGQGAIRESGNTTTVSQQSQTLSVNWTGFSIASGQTVQFLQPNSSAVALNRVTGTEASQIYGHLLANGQVFLINPNGVLFGRGAQVDVGSLVASTLNLTDADLLAGHYRFVGSPGASAAPASVVNLGEITAAPGGTVALLGGQVSNQGTLSAELGTVALAAGNAMTLDFIGRKLLNVQVDQSAVGALVDNRQLIRADGGTVIMTASARDALLNTVVNNTGVVEARTLQDQGGEIKLLGTVEGGTVSVNGTLDASAPKGGDGGSIETSGAYVKVADTAVITTLAPHGKSGNWLIDPPDFTIAASGGDITGAALGANLETGNVTILSSQGTVNVNGTGDINVDDDVTWSAGTKLTLSAVGNVNVNAAITNLNSPGNGSTVVLRADSGGACVAGAAVCGTVNFGGAGFVQADMVNLYYNPVGSNAAAGANGIGPSYASPTDYSGYVVGTVNAYMLINDVNQLQAMNTSRNSDFALGRDINASATSSWNGGAGFVPVGTATSFFTGALDGLGHTISGLTIKLPSTNLVGLFGETSAASVIGNLGLIGGSVTGTSNVGELAGVSRGTVSNTYSTGTVAGSQAGGLVGTNLGTISGSHATGAVSGANVVGGLVGWNEDIISDSYATGNVSSTNIRTGGLVGYMFGNASITRSFASGNVSSTNQYVGGLVGYFDTNGQTVANITDSYATGPVTGTGFVGGLVGAKIGTGGSVNDSYSTGAVTGSGTLGGLVGSWTGGTINGSFWDTQASGRSSSAGGGIGMSTAQMQTQADFTSATAANGNANPGWDFAGTWRMYSGHTAPLLSSFLTPLTLTADNLSVAYNGNNSNASLANVVYSDPSAATSGHVIGLATPYANARNVGTYGAALWSDQLGYNITLVNGNLTITRANLIVSTPNVTKTYDGTTTAVGTLVAAGGTSLLGTDTLSGGTFAYADKNAGAGDKTVTVSGGAINDGNGGNNYTVTYQNNNTSTINPAALTLTAASNTKNYDGTTAAADHAVVAAGSQLFGTDSISGGTFAYTDKNAGIGNKTVTAAGVTVSDGNGGANYIVTYANNTTSTINPAALTIAAVPNTRTYDGTTAAAAVPTVTGLIGADTVSSLSETYGDKNAGSGKSLSVAGYLINDSNGGHNYSVSLLPNSNGVITPANLLVTTGNVTKIYDGTTTAAGLAVAAGGSALHGADSLSGGTFAYTDKNTGTGDKTVTTSGVTINDGNAGKNYVVTYVDNTTSSITPAPVTVSGIAANDKPYDASKNATLNTALATLAGGINGDDLGVSAAGSFIDPNAGNAKTVTLTGLALTGSSKGNYVLAASGNETTTRANITPDNVTITANDSGKVAGAPLPALTVSYSGFIAGQDSSSLTTQPTVSTTATPESPAGHYPITASGAIDPNYVFSYVPGVLTVTGAATAAGPPVPGNQVPAYLGAIASASGVNGGNGVVRDADADLGLDTLITSGTGTSGPFAEERAFDTRTHSSDYLPLLSLEIINGGMKLPAGLP